MKWLQLVPELKKEEFREYFNEYLIELAEFDDEIKFDSIGKPIYKWLPYYFFEHGRYPIYFYDQNHVAGLALVREVSIYEYEIAEFYVLPCYRDGQNAIWFATELSKMFAGKLSFSCTLKNIRACKFWSKFASMFANCITEKTETRLNFAVRSQKYSTFTMKLQPQYFDKICLGKKDIEVRLNDEKRQQIFVGDQIVFSREPDENKTTTAVVLSKKKYKSFLQMAENEEAKRLGFADLAPTEIAKVYRSIYPADQEEKYGVVAIFIKNLK